MKNLIDYREHYLKLHGYLKILINSKVFYGKEDYRKELQKIISDVLPLFKWLAKKSRASKEEWESLIELFRSSYRPESTEISDIDFSDKTSEEIGDEIHYLWVCVKNICDVDLDQTSSEELESKERPSSHYPREVDSLAVYRNFFQTTVDPDPVKAGKAIDELVLRSHAWERLKHDIDTGNIYIYKTKPKRNVIIKNFLCGLLMVGLFVSVMLFFMGIFEISSNAATSAVSMILSFIAGTYCLFSFRQIRRSFLNENYKYSFQRTAFGNTLAFSVTSSLVLPFAGFNVLINTASNTNPITSPLWFLLFLIIATNFCTHVLGYFILQPKKDQPLIDNILEKHFSDLSKTLAL